MEGKTRLRVDHEPRLCGNCGMPGRKIWRRGIWTCLVCDGRTLWNLLRA